MLLLIAALLAVSPDAGFSSDGGVQVLDSSEADSGTLLEAERTKPIPVRIFGEKVLPREIYLDVLNLSPQVRATEVTAKKVQAQLLAFLQRTGFELASVEAHVADGGIDVSLNEGQIERIIFVGRMSFQLVRFKLALVLPHDVFNRPLVDRQVRELSESMGLKGVTWELVRNASVAHEGPQLEALPPKLEMSVQGTPVIHARRPYELHLFFPEDSHYTGPGIDLRSGYIDGFEGGLNYQGRALVQPGDRWQVAGGGGLGLRSRIDTEKLYTHFSRGFVGFHYDTVALLGRLRPGLWLESDWLARQRADLNLENYNALRAAISAQADLELRQGFNVLGGIGFEWRRLFGFEPAPDRPLTLDVTGNDRKRPFLRGAVDYIIDPNINRWDRRHGVEAEVREYFPVGPQPGLGWADYRYQFVKAIGWNDLWVKSRGHLSWGDVTFHDELSVGEFTRGLFGSQFVPSAINLQLEYRFSVSRDELKVSVFHDVALLATPERTAKGLRPQLADGFGPGFHVLMQDLFQLDMYVAFGFTEPGQFGAAFSAQFQKAF